MASPLLRRAALGAAAALTLTSLSTAAAQAAPGDGGTLVITLVDQFGQPAPGTASPLESSTGEPQFSQDPGSTFGSTVTYTEVPAGAYSIAAVTAFGGLACAGITPCSLPGDPALESASLTPVVTVVDDRVSTVRVQVTIPTVSGAPAVGSTLTATLPVGLRDADAAFARQAAGNPGVPRLTFIPRIQWLRAGAEIPGATGTTYTTTVADAGKAVVARFEPASGNAYLSALAGGPFFLRSNPITVSAAPTTAVAKLVGKPKVGKKPSARVTVLSGSTVATGVVAVAVGGRTVRAPLENGSAVLALPEVKAGKKYTARVTFLGDTQFAPAPATTLVYKAKGTSKGAKKGTRGWK